MYTMRSLRLILAALSLIVALPAAASAEGVREKEGPCRLYGLIAQHAAVLDRARAFVTGPFGLTPVVPPEVLSVRALVAIGKPAVPQLVWLLDRPNLVARAYAAWTLGQIGDPRARQALESRLARDGRSKARTIVGCLGGEVELGSLYRTALARMALAACLRSMRLSLSW